MAEKLDSKNSVEVPEKHYARFKFEVCPYPITQALGHLYIHCTNCKSLPTSWWIYVKFEKGSPNSCFVSLRRTDSIDKPVDAYVWVWCFDTNNRRLGFLRSFFKRGILPYVEREECIRELVSDDDLATLKNQTLVVEVSATITSCHPKVWPSDKDSDLRQMKCSKL